MGYGLEKQPVYSDGEDSGLRIPSPLPLPPPPPPLSILDAAADFAKSTPVLPPPLSKFAVKSELESKQPDTTAKLVKIESGSLSASSGMMLTTPVVAVSTSSMKKINFSEYSSKAKLPSATAASPLTASPVNGSGPSKTPVSNANSASNLSGTGADQSSTTTPTKLNWKNYVAIYKHKGNEINQKMKNGGGSDV
ncbi:hypothetical protein HK100_005060, partial [Physocladia obscura]